jgi:hypothetical protein
MERINIGDMVKILNGPQSHLPEHGTVIDILEGSALVKMYTAGLGSYQRWFTLSWVEAVTPVGKL